MSQYPKIQPSLTHTLNPSQTPKYCHNMLKIQLLEIFSHFLEKFIYRWNKRVEPTVSLFFDQCVVPSTNGALLWLAVTIELPAPVPNRFQKDQDETIG